MLTCVLQAQVEKNYPQVDPCAQVILPMYQFTKAPEICKKRGFNYFLIKKISYLDEWGQNLEFKGLPNVEGGTLVSETIAEQLGSSMEIVNVQLELLCFKEDPKVPFATHAQSVLDLFGKMNRYCPEQQNEAIEEVHVQEVKTMEELEMEIAKAKGAICLNFCSSLCPACKTLAPHFAKFAKDFSSNGTFLKVALENAPEVFDQYAIEMMPTVVVFKNHKEILRKSSLHEIFEYFDRLEKEEVYKKKAIQKKEEMDKANKADKDTTSKNLRIWNRRKRRA